MIAGNNKAHAKKMNRVNAGQPISITLRPEQRQWVHEQAARRHIPVCQLIREIVDGVMVANGEKP